MGNVLVNDAYLYGIADAIREKYGTEKKYLPSEMEDAVRGIESGDTSEFGESYWLENISKKTNLSRLFQDWTSERIPQIDISHATNTSEMFAYSNLAYIHPLDLASCTTAANMFNWSWKGTVESIEVNNTENIKNWGFFCYQSSKIKSIKTLDLSSATNVTSIIASCQNLETLLFVPNTIKISINLGSNLQLLSDESIQSIIDGLADLTGATAQTLTLHATVKAKLTEAQISQITSKNWTLA